MRIGVLADIHGHIENLQKAIARLSAEGVDKFVVLGDLIVNTTNARETVALLQECGAVGVWGNHELGLCADLDEELRVAYTPPVIEYFSTLHSQFECGDMLFSHTMPDQDATDPLTYYLGPSPDDQEALKACFAAFPHRLMLVGHFHCWFAASDQGRLDWRGELPLPLDRERRYFFIVDAVMKGCAAIIDDELDQLTPVRL